MNSLVKKYIDSVQSGQRIAGKWEKLAIDRFLNDLERDEFYFDDQYVDWLIALFHKFRFTKGKWKGKFFEIEPFQAFILANAYGFKR